MGYPSNGVTAIKEQHDLEVGVHTTPKPINESLKLFDSIYDNPKYKRVIERALPLWEELYNHNHTKGWHSIVVAGYASKLYELHNNDEEGTALIFISGLIHDIGQIKISNKILNKPDKLTGDEYSKVKTHVEDGIELIIKSGIEHKEVLNCVADHQEHWDGSGYPLGKSGNEISLAGRIICIADKMEAINGIENYSHRNYIKGVTDPAKKFAYIKSKFGEFFDPELAKTFDAFENWYFSNLV